MASRLSEETLKAVLDTGRQALEVQTAEPAELPGLPTVDLNALLHAPDPAFAVQAVPPQTLFQALLAVGPEDALEALSLASAEQVGRIFDYDCWHDDHLAPLKVVRWLTLFKELGTEQLFRRFSELDEEYQLAFLGPLVRMYDEEEFEALAETEQDRLVRMPCGTLFYEVVSEDPRLADAVESILEAALAHDMRYAYALLAHAAYMPPNEAEAQALQFRRARLEEDGFLTFGESLALFRPVDLAALKERSAFASGKDAVAAPLPAGKLLLGEVLARPELLTDAERARVEQGFGVLANGLCAATRVEPDDVAGLRTVLQQAQALASLGLEYLAGSDLGVAARLLAQETPQLLFRAGRTLVDQLVAPVLQRLEEHGVRGGEDVARKFAQDRRGSVLLVIDRQLLPVLGFELSELLKGACNRFPVRPQTRQGTKIVFTTVGSLAALQELAQRLDGLTGMLHLAAMALAPEPVAGRPLADVIRCGMERVLLGEAFHYAPLTEPEKARLAALAPETVAPLLADFLGGAEGTLRLALVPGGASPKASWSASRASGIMVAEPTAAVMAALQDLAAELQTALTGRPFTGSVI